MTPSDFDYGMNTKLPFLKQQSDDTCALACLRMVLAGFEILVSEAQIHAVARMEVNGTAIDEVERLAHLFGIEAIIQATTPADLQRILSEGRWPIAYIDRALFDRRLSWRARHQVRQVKLHAVIPTRITAASVTFHDPLPPRVARRSLRLFRAAHEIIGNLCVVCSRRERR